MDSLAYSMEGKIDDKHKKMTIAAAAAAAAAPEAEAAATAWMGHDNKCWCTYGLRRRESWHNTMRGAARILPFLLLRPPTQLRGNRVLLRGTIVNRTYGTLKNLYISLFVFTIFSPIYYDGP